MPSIAAHFVCADIVYNRIKDKINNKSDFYRGCILPDIIDLENSHYKIRGTYYLIPDIEKYKRMFDTNIDLNSGYLCHLLLDKYFLEEYIIKNIKNYDKIDLFSPEGMYNDYTNINAILIRNFNLDLNYINSIMSNIDIKVNKSKYETNIKNINNLKLGIPRYIDVDKFEKFLNDISVTISKQLKR